MDMDRYFFWYNLTSWMFLDDQGRTMHWLVYLVSGLISVIIVAGVLAMLMDTGRRR